MRISEFDWDRANVEKLQKHQVPREAIERFFISLNYYVVDDKNHSHVEQRYAAFGKFEDRYLFVLFTFRVRGGVLKIRVISARYMHQKEVGKLYEKIKNEEKSRI